jgi:hypothetical protein
MLPFNSCVRSTVLVAFTGWHRPVPYHFHGIKATAMAGSTPVASLPLDPASRTNRPSRLFVSSCLNRDNRRPNSLLGWLIYGASSFFFDFQREAHTFLGMWSYSQVAKRKHLCILHLLILMRAYLCLCYTFDRLTHGHGLRLLYYRGSLPTRLRIRREAQFRPENNFSHLSTFPTDGAEHHHLTFYTGATRAENAPTII